jgi:hypothetical protein
MNPEEFYVKDSIEFEGITENFIWYESEILRKDMRMWMNRFDKLVKVMDARHKEHVKMLQDLMYENHNLKKQLKEKNGEYPNVTPNT